MPVKFTKREDNTGLNQVRASLKKKGYVKVGVLGDDNTRIDTTVSGIGDVMTNAEIGLIQILGTMDGRIPPRDWLRMPIEEKKKHIAKYIASPPAQKLILEGKLDTVLANIGVLAEGFIQEAFESSGFGKWAPNAPMTIALKGSSQPLIDTAQLRRSVTSEVKKGKPK